MKDFINRLVRQPVLLGAAANGIVLAVFRTADNLTLGAVAGVIALFVKMYSTSSANLADEKSNSYNEALADVDSLGGVPAPPLPKPVEAD